MSEQPNIVFFMTDQLRRDALGCYGNTICKTPHLDRLAAEGVRFDQAYTVSPVCSPARASLLTGLYPHNHGVMVNTHIAPALSPGLSPDLPTFGTLLKDAGYALDYVGKWHVHQSLTPRDYGFDRIEAGSLGFEGTTTLKGKTEILPGSEINIDFDNGRPQLIAGLNGAEEADTWLAQRTRVGIEMLRDRAEGNKPFMVRIDMPEPHFACLPVERYASMYNPAEIPQWNNFEDTFEGKPPGHLRKLLEWNLQDKDWNWWQQVVARYYAVITQIDQCVGDVLAAIDDTGLAENTIFVFCTDHGDAMGSHGHFEKAGTMYDEIYRIPLLIKGPKRWVKPGVVTEFVRSLDLMPTFTQWGGATVPDDIDGVSLKGLAAGNPQPNWPDSVYCEHHGEVWGYQSQRMVRTMRWKYAYDPHAIDELYDLAADPGELINLIDSPDHADIVTEMKARLLGWNDATSDIFQWRWVRWNFPDPVSPSDARTVSRLTA